MERANIILDHVKNANVNDNVNGHPHGHGASVDDAKKALSAGGRGGARFACGANDIVIVSALRTAICKAHRGAFKVRIQRNLYSL